MSNKMITNAIFAVITMSLNGITPALAQELAQFSTVHVIGEIDGLEKCYGIAKAAQNDCGTASHNCAGESKVDNDKEAWIHVPTGVCNKIAGSSSKAPEKV